MSTTPNLGLSLFASGITGWGGAMDSNFTALDAAIHALQTSGVTGPLGPPGVAGPVGMVFAGAWTSATNYIATDVVTYNGGTYFALADNINLAPDVNTNTWAPLSIPGLAGPEGPTGPPGPIGRDGPQGSAGPQGAPGAGSGLTFPITVEEGGTGATDADQARINLSAAQSVINGDIISLTAVKCSAVPDPNNTGITIRSVGGDGTAISVGNGVDSGGITSGAGFYAKYLLCAGQITCGSFLCSSLVQTGSIGEAVPGQGVGFPNRLTAGAGLVIAGAPPATSSGQFSIGGTTSSTATAGGGGAVPATVLAYVNCTLGGVAGRLAIFAP